MKLARAMLTDVRGSGELAWRLTVRDIAAQYRQSMLGLFWAFIPPLLSGLVFVVLQQKKVTNIPDTGIPYPLFVFLGTTLWQTFTDAVNAPLRVAVGAKPVLAKINFPREALILSAFYQTLFGLLIKSILIIALLVYFHVPFGWHSALAVVPTLLLVWLGIAIGLVLTPVGMIIKDISSMLVPVLQLAFFVTPVIYPAPQSYPYSLLATWNPVSPYLLASRDLLTARPVDELAPLLVVTGLLALCSLAAWVVYRVSMPIVIERISA